VRGGLSTENEMAKTQRIDGGGFFGPVEIKLIKTNYEIIISNDLYTI